MPREDPKRVLELRMPFAATPERVEMTARMFARALAATAHDLPEGSVTMVVSNHDMRVTMRAQKPAGRRALQQLANVIANPLRTVQRRPVMKAIAEVVAKESKTLAQYKSKVFGSKGSDSIATIDDDFVSVMEGAARQVVPPEDRGLGSTEIYGHVLRIGRQDEGRELAVRLRVNGAPRELPLARDLSDETTSRLFDAARDNRLLRVKLQTSWLRGYDGIWELDTTGTEVIGAEEFDSVTGSEFVSTAAAAVEPRSDEEIDAIIAEIERR